jgi:hypothetical protein
LGIANGKQASLPTVLAFCDSELATLFDIEKTATKEIRELTMAVLFRRNMFLLRAGTIVQSRGLEF